MDLPLMPPSTVDLSRPPEFAPKISFFSTLLLCTHLVGGPGLPVGPVHMVPDVPPLDLQGVGGRPRSPEGAGHLHVLTPPRRHVVRHLGEHGCTNTTGGGWGRGVLGLAKAGSRLTELVIREELCEATIVS